MASQDTMQRANAEGQKADDLESQAQHTLQTAQQQADGMMRQAQDHRAEQQRLTQKGQDEAQHEQEEVTKRAEDAESKKGIRGIFG